MNNFKRVFLLLSLFVLVISVLSPLAVVKAADEPLFSVTVIAPGNANMVRRQWGQIFVNSLQLLGINARLVYLNWAPVYDRVFTPPYENVGLTYDEGGFDIMLVGWTPGLNPEPRQLYYGGDPNFFAPDGQNYPLWNNTEANDALDTFITSTNQTEIEETLKLYQEIFYNDMPASQIFYSATPAVVDPDLGGFPSTGPGGDGWVYFNTQPHPQTLNGSTTVVYCSTGEIESLLPPLSNSWYDTIIYNPMYSGLAENAPDLSDISVPALLTDWYPEENGFKWTFKCRTGVTWHDGFPFTADDVVYSLWALMNATGSQFVGYYKSVYGDNIKFTYLNSTEVNVGEGTKYGNITAVDAETVEAWLPELAKGKPYGYFDPFLLTFANNIIPKHIFENIPSELWTESPFNTGQGSIDVEIEGTPYTYIGPVGTGPYKWVGFDPVAQLVHLEKNDDYWDRANLEAMGAFEVQDYYIKFIADKTAALAALKNKEVHILDPNYQMQVDIPTIDPAWGRVLLLQGTGRQEIGYNMRHPIFGTGVDTPLGKSDPSKAAEAARHVRIAFDYAIPRQLIIDNLLAGFGQPGITNMLATQPFFNDALSSRPYNLTAAAEHLALAGYSVPLPPPPPTIPSFVLGMSLQISGYFTDPDTGGAVAGRELILYATKDNATYETTSFKVGETVTGLDGFYSFAVTPMETGTFYYYLFDRLAIAGTEWTYLRKIDVSSIQDLFDPYYDLISDLDGKVSDIQTQLDALSGLQDSINNATNIGYAAIAVALILGIIAIILALRKR